MDTRLTGDQGAASLVRGWKRETLAAGLQFLATIIVLSATTTSMPHALEFGAGAGNSVATVVTDQEPAAVEDFSLETVEEPFEPLIVDDIRTEGRMFAACRTCVHEESP